MIRLLLILCLASPAILGQPTLSVDLQSLAIEASADAKATTDMVRNVVAWTNGQFQWTATDYKRRTVEEIIERKGGNCNEQALVVRALLGELGVGTRRVREINIQPESERRQKNAANLVREKGPQYSVFGLRHNDHVWIEFQDRRQESGFQPIRH